MRSHSARGKVAAYAGLFFLALLVGLATHPGGSPPGGAAPAREPLVVFLQTVFWLGVAADLAVVALFVHALWTNRRRGKRKSDELEWAVQPPAMHWAVKLAVVLLALAPLWVLIAVLVFGRGSAKQVTMPFLPLTPFGASMGGRAPHTSADDYLAWVSLGIATSIVAAVSGWFWLRRRRPPLRERPVPRQDDALTEALDESLEALRSHPDPRQAVIAAYSSMERSFGRAGLARRHFEAPLEYVARILASIAVTGVHVRRLADLFELARFSRHEIDEDMRSDAIAALSSIRHELRPSQAI